MVFLYRLAPHICKYHLLSCHRFKPTTIARNFSATPVRLNTDNEQVLVDTGALSLNKSAVSLSNAEYLPPPSVPCTTEADNVGPFVGEVRLSDIGLANTWWKPGSWVQSGLDCLHFDLHLPWWQAICIGTVVVRLGMFPLVIRAQRFMAHYSNHMPTIMKLQQRMQTAVMSNNPVESERLTNEYTDYLRRNELMSLKQYAPMLAQALIFMSVFTGLRAMATLPVDSMKTGGTAWFTDLTAMDPTYMLPLLTSATLFVTIRMGADGVSTQNMPMKWMRTGFQLMPLIIFPMTAYFPAVDDAFFLSTISILCFLIPGNVSLLVYIKCVLIISSFSLEATKHPRILQNPANN